MYFTDPLMSGLQQLPVSVWLAMMAVFLVAGLVHGTIGIGFPMVATPLLALTTDMRSAIIITLLPTIAVNLISIARGGRWSESIGRYWPLAIYVAIGCVLGTQALIHLNPEPFRLLLAALILIYLNQKRTSGVPSLERLAQSDYAMFLFGVASGFAAGTVNVMMPVLIVFLLQKEINPTAMVQVFNFCFLTGKTVQSALLAGNGLLDIQVMSATAPLALAGVLALLIGMGLRSRISPERYRRWLEKLLWLIAPVLVLQYLYYLVS